MFLFLHGLAMMFSLLMGIPDGSHFSVYADGGIAQPSDGGGSIPGAGSGNGNGGG
jgi:hypothetical protein